MSEHFTALIELYVAGLKNNAGPPQKTGKKPS